jgi:hypothetical protein
MLISQTNRNVHFERKNQVDNVAHKNQEQDERPKSLQWCSCWRTTLLASYPCTAIACNLHCCCNFLYAAPHHGYHRLVMPDISQFIMRDNRHSRVNYSDGLRIDAARSRFFEAVQIASF